MENTSFNKEPHCPSNGELAAKTGFGLVVGLAVSILITMILILSSGMLDQATKNLNQINTVNPLIPILLVFVGFIGSFIGNTIIAGFYNLVFGNKYYSIKKMFTGITIVNLILFFLFIPLYLTLFSDLSKLFFILSAQTVFSVFCSYNIIQFNANPNYCASHLIGTSIGSILVFLIYIVMYKTSSASITGSNQFLITLPPLFTYLLIPLCHGLWEKLYYVFYEMGNDFLYIQSIDEVLVEEDEVDEINVEE